MGENFFTTLFLPHGWGELGAENKISFLKIGGYQPIFRGSVSILDPHPLNVYALPVKGAGISFRVHRVGFNPGTADANIRKDKTLCSIIC